MKDSSKTNWNFIGKSLVAFLITIYSIWIIFSFRYHLIDNANLIFHEAGHFLFWWFGETMHFIGGSLLQLLVPLGLIIYFAYKRQLFSSAFCGIWLGESLMNVAVYMGDAQTMLIPLVGGGTHDYNWLFAKWGILEHAVQIANVTHIIASIIVLLSLFFLYKGTWEAK